MPWKGNDMRITGRRFASGAAAMTLTAAFSIGLASEANAATLHWKVGKHVSHSHVFKGGSGNKMRCWGPTGDIPDAVMCHRIDRNTTYVKSLKANGKFKLGQYKKLGNGPAWRCQNNYKRKSGNGTWVGCHWGSKPRGCTHMRVGHGQHDWYVLSQASEMMCF